ncbi:MAG TPA: tyrosine-type recombinase/integrase [Terracidiphilus sp.]|nr:tyrosine-type recombinase/integrase [Terracidiphilus sp.]
MALKKKKFEAGEIMIFDDAVIYKRGEYWQFRMWLNRENKYARKSLHTRSETTAIEKGKNAYLEIYSNMQNGKTYFSLTTKHGVEKYLERRQKDVDSGVIVGGRYTTIKTHLQHWLDFIGRDAKLKELQRTDCENYFYERTMGTDRNVKHVTVENEQSTINACMKYLFKNGETLIDGFDFAKLPRIDSNNEAIRRATFSSEEYNQLANAMRSYCSRAKNQIDEGEKLVREVVRHYVLIAANSGLRVGEQRQLRWNDMTVERRTVSGEERILAKISVRAQTSKTRKSRVFYCRGGEYFERLKAITKAEQKDALVFSIDGKTPLSERTLLYHFHNMVDLAAIPDRETRDLVPYSLRHFMVTQRVMSGLTFQQIADMCGTSVAHIEKTYYHLNDSIMITNAAADYRRHADGRIELL